MTDAANVAIFRSDADHQWRWRVQASNGEIVASSEAYTRKADARRGWEDAARAFREAAIRDYATAGESNREDEDVEDVEGAGPAAAGDGDPAGGGSG